MGVVHYIDTVWMIKKSGMSALKWIALSPFILIGVLIGLLMLGFASTAMIRVFWDYRVDQMCEVDGGDTVYKKVFLSRQEYTKNLDPSGREIIAQWEGSSHRKGDGDFLSRIETTNIRKGFPKISKTVITIFRASDKETLAESISYHRIGGDFLNITTGYSCGGDLYIAPLLRRTVFLKEKTNDN